MSIRTFAMACACAVFVLPMVAHAEIQTEAIVYEHDGEQLEGVLCYDDAIEGSRPGVLVVHEWWGLGDYAKRRAAMLAELGYVAFAADMYGKGRFTEHPEEAGEWAQAIRSDRAKLRARALAGLDVLRSRTEVDPARLAAIGYCFGGSTVLELAYAGAPVKGVVSFHGHPVTPDAGDTIHASILVCHGADDPLIPAEVMAQWKDAMRERGADWELVEFGGAQHSFTNPEADGTKIDGVMYNEAADHRSWGTMRLFFEELFK